MASPAFHPVPATEPDTTHRVALHPAGEYDDPRDRRFHAQPTACPVCGPGYVLQIMGHEPSGTSDPHPAWRGEAAIRQTAALLRAGHVLAMKGIGGYHLACDAAHAAAVRALRERKVRKEKPFAVMAKDIDTARRLAAFGEDGETPLRSTARPIVLGRARVLLAGVAPDNPDLGVMLPYTPLHHLLFAFGAPGAMVMTSGNVSNEPIACHDAEAIDRLSGIADAILVGEREIARRLDDSVARAGGAGPVILRRSRGYAPAVVARLPLAQPVLAVGADLKNSITLVVDGQALVAPHIGDLDYHAARQAFDETISDLLAMYNVAWDDLLVVHDAHPQYTSTERAQALPVRRLRVAQHHRAHIASVLAERDVFDTPVLGVAFDGTGYRDDGTIWGGEFFVGRVRRGLARVGHLQPAVLPGGDGAARFPVQAAAGFLADLAGQRDIDFTGPPFDFPERYLQARQLLETGVRAFPTTSVGRLFDAVAALVGFTRPVTFEGQAALWLEHLARQSTDAAPHPFPFVADRLDFRPALSAVIAARLAGEAPAQIARAFHLGFARGIVDAVLALRTAQPFEAVVLSGGVFQNELLLGEVLRQMGSLVPVWTNHEVPPNDGGISLGQAALALG